MTGPGNLRDMSLIYGYMRAKVNGKFIWRASYKYMRATYLETLWLEMMGVVVQGDTT